MSDRETEAREAKLAEALRANLRRRKTAARVAPSPTQPSLERPAPDGKPD